MSEAVPPPVVQEALHAAIVVGAAPTVESDAEGVEDALTVTEAVWATATLLIVAEMVLASAVEEENVDVDTPLAFVVVGGEKLLLDPVEASATVAPAIGFPNWSFAVTVTREAVPAPVLQPLLHAVMAPGDAATVEVDPEGVPTELTVTAVVWVIATPLIVAEIVLASAVVDVKVDVETPLAFVVVGAVKLLFDPVEESTTVAPAIGLPDWSFAVTVISDAVLAPVLQPLLHAVIVVGAAPSVDDDADTLPAESVIVPEVSGVRPVALNARV